MSLWTIIRNIFRKPKPAPTPPGPTCPAPLPRYTCPTPSPTPRTRTGGGGGGAAPSTQPAVSVTIVDEPTPTTKVMKEEPPSEVKQPPRFTFRESKGFIEEVKPSREITPFGISIESQELEKKKGFRGFVGGVVETIKTAPTYQEAVKGITQEFKQAFPRAGEKVGAVVGEAKKIGAFYFKPIKYITKKGQQVKIPGEFTTFSTLVPTREEYAVFKESPKGKQAIQTTETLLMGAMVTPAGLGRQLIVETIPLRQRVKPYAVEEIQTAVIKGKPTRFSDYAIITEKHPPRIQITHTLTRSQMGKKPIDVKYLPKEVSRVGTPFKATAQEPFIVVEAPKGIISKVTGVSQRLDVMKFEQLPPTQKFLVKRLAEAKAGGRPVADSRVIKMFGREDLRFASQIEVEQLAKMKPDPYFLRLKRVLPERGLVKPGKAIRRYEAVTEIKLLKETEFYEFTKSRILFKDVTFPGARAAGKTPELKVFTLEYKQPIVIGKEKVTGIIKPADIVKTPLRKTFQQLQQESLIPKLPPPKTPKAIITTKTIPAPKQPKAIARVSAFAGTGMYERTIGGQLPAMHPAQIQRDIARETQFIKAQPREIETQITRLVPKHISKSRAKAITKLTPKEITKEMTKVISKTIQKQRQKLIQKQIQKPMQKIIQKPFSFPREPFTKTPFHKLFPLFVPPLFGQLLPQKGILGTRLYKETPSLADVMRFEMGYKVPKIPKVFAETGLIGFGIGKRLPRIELGSLLGKVKKIKKKNKTQKTNRRNKK